MGIYKRHNIALTIKNVPSSPSVMKAFLGGRADVTIVNSLEQMTAAAAGADIKIIGGFAPGNPFVIASRQNIASVDDLKGKSIGISKPGGFPQIVAVSLLDSAGISRKKVNWVNAGKDSDRVRALAAGKIDAALVAVDYVPTIKKQPNLKVLSVIAEDQPRFISQAIAVHKSLIEQNRGLLVRFMAANREAIRYALKHKQKVVDQETERLSKPDKEVSQTFDWYVEHDVWTPKGFIPKKTFRYMQNLNVRLGLQEEKLAIDKLVNWKIQEAALEGAGGQ